MHRESSQVHTLLERKEKEKATLELCCLGLQPQLVVFSTTNCAVLVGVQDTQAKVVIAAAEQSKRYTLQKALSIDSQASLTVYIMFVAELYR